MTVTNTRDTACILPEVQTFLSLAKDDAAFVNSGFALLQWPHPWKKSYISYKKTYVYKYNIINMDEYELRNVLSKFLL